MQNLPSYILVETPATWQACLHKLQAEPRLAIDLEANSMFAYQERACLIQISIPDQDYIIDPLPTIDLAGLGAILANPAVEKIFHAAEYDLTLLKRDYDWEVNNLFDTMWATRILGYDQYGLANILESRYQVKLDKRYQRSNWCKRPLTSDQLAYAQHDTHFLLRLRDDLAQALQENGHWDEAQEIFAELTYVTPINTPFDPDGFWSINGANDLTRSQQAILRELYIFRDREARRRDQPLFKVLSDGTLLAIAQVEPTSLRQLRPLQGMSAGQIRRYGETLLELVAQGQRATYPRRPKRPKRPSEAVLARYEKLRQWRKKRAIKRGVESDVILSRDMLWQLAKENPQTPAELTAIDTLGEWRRATYGADILQLLKTK